MTGVFVSYRREDTRHVAGRLYDRLVEVFGAGQVFMDVDSLEPGVDFAQAIEQAVGSCQVQLVLIGRQWLSASDRSGRRRLDDPDDYVALEVGAALSREIRVIPVLVDGAKAPPRDELPRTLEGLARRNGVPLDHESFRTDVLPLLEALRRMLQPPVSSGPRQSRDVQPTPEPAPPLTAGRPSGLVGTFDHPGKWGILGRKAVQAVALSPDDRWLATLSEDNTARLWEVDGGARRGQQRSAAVRSAQVTSGSRVCTDTHGSPLNSLRSQADHLGRNLTVQLVSSRKCPPISAELYDQRRRQDLYQAAPREVHRLS